MRWWEIVQEDAQGVSPLQQWIAGSVFVNAQGEPLKLYHGTSKDMDFRAFKMPKNGIWLTTDRDSASDYAMQNDSQGSTWDSPSRSYKPTHTASRVIPVYVRAMKVKSYTDWPDQIRLADNYKRQQGILFDQLRMQGYDAIDFNDSIIVVIGSPNQIKSAIGNKMFNPAKKNIDEGHLD